MNFAFSTPKALMLTMLLCLSPMSHANSTPSISDGILAKVNNEVILQSELITAMSDLAQRYQQNKLAINPQQLQQQALDELITRKLQLDIINKAGFSPDETVINQQLLQLATAQGFNSLAQFQQHLENKQSGSYTALRKQLIEDASLTALWQAQVAPRINISEQEVDVLLNSPEGVTIANEQVLLPEWKTSHILARIDSTQTEALAEQKINVLYQQLQQGADFASLAATYSDDTGSASQSGQLGWVGENQMVPAFEAMMKNTQVGDYSTPFRSPFGWHILKVEDVRQRDISTQYRRNLAKEVLFSRLAPQAEEDWVQELKAGAYIEILPVPKSH